jgi:hypothetical protein
VDLTATINNVVDHHDAIRILKSRLARGALDVARMRIT